MQQVFSECQNDEDAFSGGSFLCRMMDTMDRVVSSSHQHPGWNLLLLFCDVVSDIDRGVDKIPREKDPLISLHYCGLGGDSLIVDDAINLAK